MAPDEIYHCGCGAWTGERCGWTGPASEMVTVEYMPEYLRASHTAARTAGAWSHNGAVRVAVERSCAALLLEDDAEQKWSAIVDTDPSEYAEEG